MALTDPYALFGTDQVLDMATVQEGYAHLLWHGRHSGEQARGAVDG
jgi:hypothetical protein